MRRGYHVPEVDSFLIRINATLAGEPIGAPVTAREVREVLFRVRFGGYDEWQVDGHLDRVARQLEDLETPSKGTHPVSTESFGSAGTAVAKPARAPRPGKPPIRRTPRPAAPTLTPAPAPTGPSVRDTPRPARHAAPSASTAYESTPSIFISYRRADVLHAAHRLYDYLSDQVADGSVFIDMDTIEPGADFLQVIEDAVAQCRVLLAVIGPSWLATDDPLRGPRLNDPMDYVRLEIETALNRGITVIPVLIDTATMPSAEALPPSLAPIVRRQAFFVRPNTFRNDCVALAQHLKRTLAL